MRGCTPESDAREGGDDAVMAPAGGSGGRHTGDIPLPVLVAGVVVFAGAAIGFAALGGGIGVVLAAIVIALGVLVAIHWSDAPFVAAPPDAAHDQPAYDDQPRPPQQ